MSAGEAAFTALDYEIKEFLKWEPVIRESDDPEAVHDMRVAARRIRAAFDVFAAFLPEVCLEYEPDVKWVFRCLGDVRDCDIELERLAKYESAPAKPLLAALNAKRRKAKIKLLRSLQSARYTEVRDGLSSAVAKGPSARNPSAAVPMPAAAPDLVQRRFRKLDRAGAKVKPDSSVGDFHAVRKQAKRFRYTIDFFAEMYGPPAKDLIAQLKRLQDMLGARQDDMMLLQALKDIEKRAKLPAPSKKLIKKVIQDIKTEMGELGADFESLFEPIRKDHWRKLRTAMRKSRRRLWKRS